ncbi:MAG: Fic family protein [Candidatus Uhrbacteria bacterium]|nr:Fic family protein [Candidatus Uhrbacteria bacterium]
MREISKKYQKIADFFVERTEMQSSDVYAELIKLGDDTSLVTVKRTLSGMVGEGLLRTIGSGRSAGYTITPKGRIFANIDARRYCSVDPDKRGGLDAYNFDLFPALPLYLFTDNELEILNDATAEYLKRTTDLSPAIQKKELERLVIELSWKSSKIEGNTYTLLDTEKLILEQRVAPGHSKEETQMILNHKDAFDYARRNSGQFKTLTRKNLEELHAIIVHKLSVGLGLRAKPVGITGSKYLPLDNIHQISDAIQQLSAVMMRMKDPYSKALVALVGVSYIQPFEDGNKRTGRMMTNALLLSHGLAPISYRSVDENEYKEAMLVFYELNSMMPIKKIFIAQYDFAARNYAVK